jgi:hypothetical protein
MTATATHACPCTCGQQLPPGRFTCPQAWDRLPDALREAVRTEFTARRRAHLAHEPELAEAVPRVARDEAIAWLLGHPLPAARYARGACKSCQAPIIWATSTRTGDPMPVDAEPVDVNTGGGDVLLTARPGTSPLARVVTNPAYLFGVKAVYRRHSLTCPFAARYRRRRRP